MYRLYRLQVARCSAGKQHAVVLPVALGPHGAHWPLKMAACDVHVNVPSVVQWRYIWQYSAEITGSTFRLRLAGGHQRAGWLAGRWLGRGVLLSCHTVISAAYMALNALLNGLL